LAVRTLATLIEKRFKSRTGPLPTTARTRDLLSMLVWLYVPHVMARFAAIRQQHRRLPLGVPRRSHEFDLILRDFAHRVSYGTKHLVVAEP
jgi:hypothetical protein